jgi:hypothetical protein
VKPFSPSPDKFSSMPSVNYIFFFFFCGGGGGGEAWVLKSVLHGCNPSPSDVILFYNWLGVGT